MKLVWLGHSTFSIETGNAKILIDPFLTGNPTFEASGVDKAGVTAGTTNILITHGHDDHVGDTVEIAKATGATVSTNYELCNWLAGKGVEKIDPINHGGTVSHDGFTASFVNALHSSSTIIDGTPVYLGNPLGVVVKAEGHSIYHMGDTDIMPDMALIQEAHAPTVGLVPIGDRFTMGAKGAAHACQKYFKFKTIVPIHYGTFPILDQSPDAFVSEMAGHNVVVPNVGEAVALG